MQAEPTDRAGGQGAACLPLVLIGAGGLGREAAAAVAAVNAVRPTWHLIGYLDDDPALHAAWIGRDRVLGPLAAGADMSKAHRLLCVASRREGGRAAVAAEVPGPYATVVHPTAALGSGSRVGEGSIVLAAVVATADVSIGAHCVLMPHVVLTHDDVLEDHVICAAGVRLAGGVRVGHGAYLGSGCSIREGVRIGAGATIGMGAVVLEDVPPGEIWVGVPARRLVARRRMARVSG